MRRWALRIGGLVVGLVVVVVGPAVFLDRSHAPFAFLDGRHVVASRGDDGIVDGVDTGGDYYTFRADPGAFERAARSELAASGYHPLQNFGEAVPFGLHIPGRYGITILAGTVTILKDPRYTKFGGLCRDTGWVTVVVSGSLPERRPTVFDGIRSKLGL